MSRRERCGRQPSAKPPPPRARTREPSPLQNYEPISAAKVVVELYRNVVVVRFLEEEGGTDGAQAYEWASNTVLRARSSASFAGKGTRAVRICDTP